MPASSSTMAFLAAGSNLGDRKANIQLATEKLGQTPGIQVVRISRFLENPAVGMDADAPPFLNAAIEIQTTLGAHALLRRLLEIERDMGRQRHKKWEPRIIDLDLLLYGDEILSTQELIVPHPLMHERRFVLEPLAEIAPNVIHPTSQLTIAGLLQKLESC